MSSPAGSRRFTIVLTIAVATVGVGVVAGVAALGWALIR